MSIITNNTVNIVKNYLLWPILALVSTFSVYLILVACTHNILIFSSLEQEELLWKYISKDLSYKQIDYEKQRKIQSLVNTLPVEILPKQYTAIKILVLNSKQVNAFAAPGGRVILTTELLNKIVSEQALLFVIGHEIAHLARKDHLYEFAKMLVAKFYGYMIRSEIVTELLMLIDSYKIRETEFLADKYSAKIILDYYGNIKGAEEFFEYIMQNNYYDLSASHPETRKRLKNVNLLLSY